MQFKFDTVAECASNCANCSSRGTFKCDECQPGYELNATAVAENVGSNSWCIIPESTTASELTTQLLSSIAESTTQPLSSTLELTTHLLSSTVELITEPLSSTVELETEHLSSAAEFTAKTLTATAELTTQPLTSTAGEKSWTPLAT